MHLATYIVQCKLSNGYWGFTWAVTWNTEGAIAVARERYGRRLVSVDVVERKTGKFNLITKRAAPPQGAQEKVKAEEILLD